MTSRQDHWSISTRDGVSLDAEVLLDVLAEHHHRLIETWEGFAPAQWVHPSRNTEWTVHQTVRHVADAMERVKAVAEGDQALDKNEFDPRSTPTAWLSTSDGESPEATIERFAEASTSYRAVLRDRFTAGENADERTVFGTAHWTVNVAHVFWDSWLHERDVLLPLGQPSPSPEGEQRLVGLYGLLVALVPSMMFEQSVSSTVELRGLGLRTIEVSCEPGLLRSVEVPAVADAISGEVAAAVDALAGRGAAVDDVLPDAPEQLSFLAAFFNS